MPVSGVCQPQSRGSADERVVRLGVPLLDEYLEFLAGRCRPNTVLAVAYDLKVFSTVVRSGRGGSARSMCWRSRPRSARARKGTCR
jgi:hypothetical protein